MGSAVIERETEREAHTGFRMTRSKRSEGSVCFSQSANTIFNHVGNVNHLHSRLDGALGILSYLTMNFGRSSNGIVVESGLAGVESIVLLVCRIVALESQIDHESTGFLLYYLSFLRQAGEVY